jgi:phenylacetate-CoA ligase
MNPILVRRVIYPTYRMLRHDRVLANLAEMQRIDGLAPDEIRELQWGKLKTILEHASRNVPYYRRVFKSVGATAEDIRRPEDLSALPILRKQDIRENLQDLISETPHRTDLAPEETGGSTGQNLFFYVDRQALKARLANNARMNAWLGVRIGDRKASLWGMRFREHRLEKLKRTIKCWFDNTLYVSAYKMDAETIDRTARRLIRFKPDMLIAFPSSLYHFATSAGAVAADKIRPKVITTSGETLYDWQRSAIEAAFCSPVYNHYGCCEFGAIARECSERNGLHFAADRVYIESVPMTAQGSADSVCELVVSGLDNYGMPFIRYAIEDLGQVTWDRCSCGLGLPRLTSLAGRVYDIVQAPNGNFLGGTFWGHILKQGVEKFQVIQEELNEVKIIVVPTADFGDATKKYVLGKVREACGDQMKVVFDLKDDIDLTPSGKHRYVISRLLRRNDAAPKR